MNVRLFDFPFAARMYNFLGKKIMHQILFPVNIFFIFPNPAPCFGQIQDPKIPLSDPETKPSMLLYYETLRLELFYK